MSNDSKVWGREAPTERGSYLWRSKPGAPFEVVDILPGGFLEDGGDPADIGGQWCPPIPSPEVRGILADLPPPTEGGVSGGAAIVAILGRGAMLSAIADALEVLRRLDARER